MIIQNHFLSKNTEKVQIIHKRISPCCKLRVIYTKFQIILNDLLKDFNWTLSSIFLLSDDAEKTECENEKRKYQDIRLFHSVDDEFLKEASVEIKSDSNNDIVDITFHLPRATTRQWKNRRVSLVRDGLTFLHFKHLFLKTHQINVSRILQVMVRF